MSTFGVVEKALQDLARAAELVGYAVERANRADGKPAHAQLVERAEQAGQARARARDALLEAVHEYATAQYQVGLDMGRESALSKQR